ncbi:UNVERIFIED_CONTAM: hypothetical protein Cloal_0169 [Acetivibrio alkalicellulosi]
MFSKKIENFWYYHKTKVIVIAFLIIFIAISWDFNRSQYIELEIAYVLEDQVISWEGMQEVNQIFESVLQKEDDEIEGIQFTPLQGAMIDYQIAMPSAHIFLVDDKTLEKYIDIVLFEPLDHYVEKYNIDISNHPEIIVDSKDTDGIVYALPFKKLKFLVDYGFPEYDYYFTIRIPHDNTYDIRGNENAHTILKYILDNS